MGRSVGVAMAPSLGYALVAVNALSDEFRHHMAEKCAQRLVDLI
jgi:hypothetical protein